MANDRQVITYLAPAELVALMNASGVITVHETGMSDGKPVIHAAVKVVNAETGEQLSGGLPFSVVMFKNPKEPGYTNIAIGTIVPAAELDVRLPRDYFNFCNQRFRFTRVYPVDEGSFVIQMDLVVKNATREYIKFGFGLWGAIFSQMLFELLGRGRESLESVADAYAKAHTDFAGQIASEPATEAPVEEPALDTPITLAPEAIVEAPIAEAAVEEAKVEERLEPAIAEPAATEAAPVEVAVSETPVEPAIAEAAPVEQPQIEPPVELASAEAAPVEEVTAEEVTAEAPAEPAGDHPYELPLQSEMVEIVAAPVEGEEFDAEPELSIAAGPAAVAAVETPVEVAPVEPAAVVAEAVVDSEAKEPVPA